MLPLLLFERLKTTKAAGRTSRRGSHSSAAPMPTLNLTANCRPSSRRRPRSSPLAIIQQLHQINHDYRTFCLLLQTMPQRHLNLTIINNPQQCPSVHRHLNPIYPFNFSPSPQHLQPTIFTRTTTPRHSHEPSPKSPNSPCTPTPSNTQPPWNNFPSDEWPTMPWDRSVIIRRKWAAVAIIDGVILLVWRFVMVKCFMVGVLNRVLGEFAYLFDCCVVLLCFYIGISFLIFIVCTTLQHDSTLTLITNLFFLRTLVVFCHPSALGLPIFPTQNHHPNNSIPNNQSQYLASSSLPEPNAQLLQQIQQRYPDSYQSLPDPILSPNKWKVYNKFCHFSGLPIAEGEMHYRIKPTLSSASFIDGTTTHPPESNEIALSQQVMEAINGQESAEILRLPNQKTLECLRWQYGHQCNKLREVVFDRTSWEMVMPEI